MMRLQCGTDQSMASMTNSSVIAVVRTITLLKRKLLEAAEAQQLR